jgi:hypothetical protein
MNYWSKASEIPLARYNSCTKYLFRFSVNTCNKRALGQNYELTCIDHEVARLLIYSNFFNRDLVNDFGN